MIELVPLSTIDEAAVEQLLDRAFGTDRHMRTAYRVREGTHTIAALSFAAVDDGVLVGSIQCWPVMLESEDGGRTPLVMVGPVAVEPKRQLGGIGHSLMRTSLDAAKRLALDGALALIGDPEYYARFFGFSAERTAKWRVPGPIERHRLLARGDDVPDCAGLLSPRVATTV